MPAVGMVGAGQLARMTHQAAIGLGVGFRVLAGHPGESAARVCGDVTVGDYTSLGVLRDFAKGCDVLTFDHEHVRRAHLQALLAEGAAVRPGPEALHHAQDKAAMRRALAAEGMPGPPVRLVYTADDVAALAEEAGWPLVLKVVLGGYDGRGVWVVESLDAARRLLEDFEGSPLLGEQYVPFRRELAALVARSPHGQTVTYPIVQTVQQEGICREILAPAPGLDRDVAAAAQRLALDIAGALNVVGLLAVELFETEDGVLVNELAMRPHNTGHWTLDGSRTSQFEQHLRAVLDLPLGSPQPTAPCAVTANVLGGEDPDVYDRYVHVMAHDPSVKVHMYGKEVRPGRKIGHVTALGEDPGETRARAQHAAGYLRGVVR